MALDTVPGHFQGEDGAWYPIGGWPPAADRDVVDPAVEAAMERLRPMTVADIRERVRDRGPRSWSIERFLPQGTQSSNAAARKSFKSYNELDANISIATGTPYLGVFRTTPAPVICYLSEFEEATFDIRLDAICRSRGIDPDRDLDLLEVNFRPPRITSPADVTAVTRLAREREARLMTIDPFYKSAGGVKLSDLVSTGAALNALTESLAEIGCGLRFVHHARKAAGEGLDLFSGVGLQEWSRVASTMRVSGKARHLADEWIERDVILDVEGNDIAPRSWRITFRLRGDENVLDAPRDYEVTVADADELDADSARLAPGKRRVLAALRGEEFVEVAAIQEATAHDGGRRPLQMETVSTYLRDLEEEGLVEGTDGGRGRPRRWRRVIGEPR